MPIIKFSLCACLLLILLILGEAFVAEYFSPFDHLRNDHISAHVPPTVDFDSILQRDLTAAFSRRFQQPVRVRCTLLQPHAVQTGMGFPHFYSWIVVFAANDEPLAEGAVRLTAMDRVQFAVSGFLSKAEIISDVRVLDGSFPSSVHDEIRKRL